MPPPQIYHDNLAQGAVDDAEEEEGIANFTRVYPQPLGGGAAGQDAPGSKKVRQKNGPMTRSCNARSAWQMQDATSICATTQRMVWW